MSKSGAIHQARIDAAIAPLLYERDDLDTEVARLKTRLSNEAREYGARLEALGSVIAELRENNAALNSRLNLVEEQLSIERADHAKDLRDLNAQTAALASLKRAAKAFDSHVDSVLGHNVDIADAEVNLGRTEEEIKTLMGHNKGPMLVEHIPQRRV